MFAVRAFTVFRASAQPARRALATAVNRQDAHAASTQDNHTYLRGLLDSDDADAPWHQNPVEMVSREVQAPSFGAHESW
ncbi:hypothetical protein IWW50_006793 [Coemansia erecta]|nr:hypothetical protein GGF43_004702 [Coemansia sp. RSA 2618]KAJ2815552.1 hypothetical protein IWW50_006793 [Coemansia erecta]